MSTETLFELPPKTRPSKTDRLNEFIAKHGILTHYNKLCKPDTYLALLPDEDHVGMDLVDIMSRWARCYDDSNRVTHASSKLAAVRELARLNKIPCDL